MIYHRDVPLKSFLPEKLFLAKQGSTAPFPPLLAPCRCNLVFGANVSAEMNPEWIMDTGARLMEGSRFQIRGHRYFRVMFADIGIFIPMNFLPSFFFYFQFYFFPGIRAWIWWWPLSLHDTSLAQIFIVFAGYFFFGNFV